MKPTMKPYRGAYAIACRDGSKELVDGWVLGDFGARKERYSWRFTHVPSGLAMSRTAEDKADALAQLMTLWLEGPAERERSVMDHALAAMKAAS